MPKYPKSPDLQTLFDKKQNVYLLGDNLPLLRSIPDGSHQVIYIDPPFNTGKTQKHTRMQMTETTADKADRKGFGGKNYRTKMLEQLSYNDTFQDLLEFLGPRLEEAHRILSSNGTLYFHIDWREVHYCRLLLDQIFGTGCCLNEIIWAYDYGAKPKNRWPAKHDNILVYTKDPKKYYFDNERVEREPYMAPGLVTEEKRKKGKMPTDVMWHTIVPTNGRERTGYPTQKPEGLLRRFISASCPPDGRVLDFFAGSGTIGAVCRDLGHPYTLIDQNKEVIPIWQKRFDLPKNALLGDQKDVDKTSDNPSSKS